MESGERQGNMPVWLAQPQAYEPSAGRDRYLRRTLLSLAGMLVQLRVDDGRSSRLSPSAPVKLLLAFGCILLVSLSRNYAFTTVLLAFVLVRACFLPAKALRRVASVAVAAAALTFALMLPAVLVGQPQSALNVATKALVSVGLVLAVATTTPHHELTGALRAFHVPALFVLTVDLALKNIVSLGKVAVEVLTALRLRSVGRSVGSGQAIGGVGGTVLLKSADAAADAYEAMTCRCFDGDYRNAPKSRDRAARFADVAWVAAFALLAVAFFWLEGAL